MRIEEEKLVYLSFMGHIHDLIALCRFRTTFPLECVVGMVAAEGAGMLEGASLASPVTSLGAIDVEPRTQSLACLRMDENAVLQFRPEG